MILDGLSVGNWKFEAVIHTNLPTLCRARWPMVTEDGRSTWLDPKHQPKHVQLSSTPTSS